MFQKKGFKEKQMWKKSVRIISLFNKKINELCHNGGQDVIYIYMDSPCK